MLAASDHSVNTGITQPVLPTNKRTVGHPFYSLSFWACAVFGASISIIITGFAFPTNNNIFHLPIVGELYNSPGFADDEFIQSLRNFSSGLWWIFSGSSEWIEPGSLFFIGFFLSRLLSFVGFLACADYFGVREARHRFLFASLISMTPLMQGYSYAGSGGLFINYFTHTEVANGLFLLAIWAGLCSNYGRAIALCGLTFFVNAFVGAWLGFVLAVFFVREVLLRRMVLLRPDASLLFGFFVGSAFAAPVVRNIVMNPDFGVPHDFDYLEFLTEYYPFHFLIWSIPVRESVRLALVLAIGGAALYRLPDPDRRFLSIFLACFVLYGIGVVVPWVTHAPLVLNLHLLRSGTLLHLLSAFLLSTVVVRWWFGAATSNMVAALLIVLVLSLSLVVPRGQTLMLLAIFGILACNPLVIAGALQGKLTAILESHRLALTTCVVIFMILSAGLLSYRNQQGIADHRAMAAEWNDVGKWAAANTDVGSVFLVPDGASTDFEFLSRRSIWVDWKRGAAVMWSPSYYKTWKERLNAISRLRTLEEMMNYARANGISYLINSQASSCLGTEVYRTTHLCVVRVD